MKQLAVFFTMIILMAFSLSAQEMSDVNTFSSPGVGFGFSGAESEAAYLDFSRIQMHQSVSMSMGNSAFGSESYLTYHNQLFMPLGSRMSFYGNLYWQLQAYVSNPALERLNSPAGEIYFDANLNYRLGENSSISLGIARYPASYYLPYGSGYYPFTQSSAFSQSMWGGFLR